MSASEVYELKELAEKDFGKPGKGQHGMPRQLFHDVDYGATDSWEYLELCRTMRCADFGKWWMNVVAGVVSSRRVYDAVLSALKESDVLDRFVKQLKTLEMLQLVYRWRFIAHGDTPQKSGLAYDRICDATNFWEYAALRSKKPEEGRTGNGRDGFFRDSCIMSRPQFEKPGWKKFCAKRFALLDEVFRRSPVVFAKLWQAHFWTIARYDCELVKWMWKKFDRLGRKDSRCSKLSAAMCQDLLERSWPNGYCASD